jgi:hypothetical protein
LLRCAELYKQWPLRIRLDWIGIAGDVAATSTTDDLRPRTDAPTGSLIYALRSPAGGTGCVDANACLTRPPTRLRYLNVRR